MMLRYFTSGDGQYHMRSRQGVKMMPSYAESSTYAEGSLGPAVLITKEYE